MFRQIFGNIPDVTKNLLILNVLFFLATAVLEGQGIYLKVLLSEFYPTSEYFRPYQIITHFFMHADIRHIFFNMFGLVVFGSHLERVWGKQRFFVFYFVTAIGASILYGAVHAFEIYNYTGLFFPDYDTLNEMYKAKEITATNAYSALDIINTPSLGASGAIYGLIMAFALLFPNTEFQMLFLPIRIKAKWIAIGLGLMALYGAYERAEGDSIAHFAHLGGMLFGFIMIKIWQKNSNTFY